MFCKDDKCMELLGQCEDESRVLHETFYGAFIASVEEQGTRILPVVICYKNNSNHWVQNKFIKVRDEIENARTRMSHLHKGQHIPLNCSLGTPSSCFLLPCLCIILSTCFSLHCRVLDITVYLHECVCSIYWYYPSIQHTWSVRLNRHTRVFRVNNG